jgi:hypothetical protein
MSIERQASRFATDVADAIAAIKSGHTDYGEFYVRAVLFGFSGEDAGFRVVPNEHGGYDIEEASAGTS